MNAAFFTLACLTALSQSHLSRFEPNNDSLKSPSAKLGFDPMFPLKGKFHAGLISTYSGSAPSPALIGDITYGISKKFSLAITGGSTGALALYGVKTNVQLFRQKDWRLIFRMTSIYYPERRGAFLLDRREKHVMPWMLSMAVVDSEWKAGRSIRWSVGAGFLETNCAAGMEAWLNKIFYQKPVEKNLYFFKTFTTIQSSISLPISARLYVRPEVFLVFRGARLIERNEFKITFPVNPYIYLVYKL